MSNLEKWLRVNGGLPQKIDYVERWIVAMRLERFALNLGRIRMK